MKLFVVEHRERASDYDTSVVVLVASTIDNARLYCEETRIDECEDGNVVWSWYEISVFTLDQNDEVNDVVEVWGKYGVLKDRPLEGY